MIAPRVSEKPILFSGEMVRAILEGRKTQTRRVIRIDDSPILRGSGDRQRGIPSDAQNVRFCSAYLKCDSPAGSYTVSSRVPCPYGESGDRLWVKETFYDCHHDTKKRNYEYRADWSPAREADERDFAWRPSIFMPRSASRITLEISAVGVQRLHQITDQDARAEGCCGVTSTQWGVPNFRWLWDSINAKRGFGWETNPWVWVITFRRIE